MTQANGYPLVQLGQLAPALILTASLGSCPADPGILHPLQTLAPVRWRVPGTAALLNCLFPKGQHQMT